MARATDLHVDYLLTIFSTKSFLITAAPCRPGHLDRLDRNSPLARSRKAERARVHTRFGTYNHAGYVPIHTCHIRVGTVRGHA